MTNQNNSSIHDFILCTLIAFFYLLPHADRCLGDSLKFGILPRNSPACGHGVLPTRPLKVKFSDLTKRY